ncbi:AMP-binding protein [Rhodococcus spelaei]|uniref:AMP-binding protein n=1 Tax=Rhodococcus spelaei TaxID=2546320 RepID=A0A541B0X5_9NOCA|nr:fatty acid CoA ligase family protein [Rhodococcus spelaei]TQF65975.1 AMP-binding protein [Rhodococcus spelaei]
MTTAAPRAHCGSVARLRAIAAEHPGREAVIHADGGTDSGTPRYARLTYRELDDWSDLLAQRFEACGIGRGMRTLLLVTPGPEFYAIMFGLLKVSAVPVVIDPGMGLRPMLRCLKSVAPQAFVGISKAHLLRLAFRRTFATARVRVTVGRRAWGGHSLRSWGRTPDRPVAPTPAAPDDEVMMIAFTTGSTGPAKAVNLTHGNLAAMLEQVDEARDRIPPGTSLITLPIFGVLDLMLGSRCVLPPIRPGRVGEVDPAHVVDAIDRFEVRTLFASPAVLVPLVRYGRAHGVTLSSVRSVFSGGAPVPHDAIAGLREMLPDDGQVSAGYGSTEALPMSAIESRELLGEFVDRAHAGAGTCLGRPAHGVHARIIAITDDAVPDRAAERAAAAGGIGEIVVAGPNVSTSYHWPVEANALGKIRDGDRIWHRTGDLGWIDEAGRIWFCGRKSQRVQTADGPLFTVQCEQIFNAVPDVARTALVGVGSVADRRPVLCVELQPGVGSGQRPRIEAKLRELGAQSHVTARIEHFLFHPGFPVDIRHNAKIGREKLSVWAQRQLAKESR